jgi:hypothetical protein
MSAPYLSLADYLASMESRLILAQDGGGMQGYVSLGFLLEIEGLLRARHGSDPNFRLCDYFDLIAGTSTVSIIAASLHKVVLSLRLSFTTPNFLPQHLLDAGAILISYNLFCHLYA